MKNSEISLRDHFMELRKRLIVSVLAVLIGTGIAFSFWQDIVLLLEQPARSFGEYSEQGLVFTEVTEVLSTSFKISMLGGFIFAFPIIAYQIIRFISPGLRTREKIYLLILLPFSVLAFLAGVAFAYFILTPSALHFLLTFGSDVATPFIKISNIVSVMIRLLFWMGLCFQMPIIMFVLAKIGLITYKNLGSFRKYWLILAFVLAAIITPTFDPINQLIVAVPLLILYEIGFVLTWVTQKLQSRKPI
jgi:sec-independent protein translocase protein TatC